LRVFGFWKYQLQVAMRHVVEVHVRQCVQQLPCNYLRILLLFAYARYTSCADGEGRGCGCASGGTVDVGQIFSGIYNAVNSVIVITRAIFEWGNLIQ